MTGVTAGGIPYVTPEDHPLEFPTHSQGLAAKLNGALGNTASLAPTYLGSWAKRGTDTPMIIRRGSMCGLVGGTLYWNNGGAAPPLSSQVCVLPSWATPALKAHAPVTIVVDSDGAYKGVGFAYADPAGFVYMFTPSGQGVGQIHSYVLGLWWPTNTALP